MQDILNFFKLDLYQLIELIRPAINTYGLFLIPIIGFSRSIPIIGLVTNRIPLFMALCIFATSFLEIILIIIAFTCLSLIADLLTYTKMSKFWLYFINKIPENSKIDKIIQYYKKKPILITIAGTYSAYTSCLLTPFARKFHLNVKNFWLPRYITFTLILIIYGILYYILGKNIIVLNNVLGKFGIVIVVFILLGIIINILYGIKFLSDIKFLSELKHYLNRLHKH